MSISSSIILIAAKMYFPLRHREIFGIETSGEFREIFFENDAIGVHFRSPVLLRFVVKKYKLQKPLSGLPSFSNYSSHELLMTNFL